VREKPCSFRLPTELYDELQRSAEAHGEPVSVFIRRAIEMRLRPAASIPFVAPGCSNLTFGYQPPAGIMVNFP